MSRLIERQLPPLVQFGGEREPNNPEGLYRVFLGQEWGKTVVYAVGEPWFLELEQLARLKQFRHVRGEDFRLEDFQLPKDRLTWFGGQPYWQLGERPELDFDLGGFLNYGIAWNRGYVPDEGECWGMLRRNLQCCHQEAMVEIGEVGLVNRGELLQVKLTADPVGVLEALVARDHPGHDVVRGFLAEAVTQQVGQIEDKAEVAFLIGVYGMLALNVMPEAVLEAILGGYEVEGAHCDDMGVRCWEITGEMRIRREGTLEDLTECEL